MRAQTNTGFNFLSFKILTEPRELNTVRKMKPNRFLIPLFVRSLYFSVCLYLCQLFVEPVLKDGLKSCSKILL